MQVRIHITNWHLPSCKMGVCPSIPITNLFFNFKDWEKDPRRKNWTGKPTKRSNSCFHVPTSCKNPYVEDLHAKAHLMWVWLFCWRRPQRAFSSPAMARRRQKPSSSWQDRRFVSHEHGRFNCGSFILYRLTATFFRFFFAILDHLQSFGPLVQFKTGQAKSAALRLAVAQHSNGNHQAVSGLVEIVKQDT